MKRTRESAFTLLELTMVLAILAIITAIAAPRYAAAINRYRSDLAIRRIINDLAMVQAKARTTSATRSVIFDVPANQYRMPGEIDPVRRTDPYTVTLSDQPYLATLVSANFNDTPQVQFNGYGNPLYGGNVVINAGGVQKTINVNADSGAITVP